MVEHDRDVIEIADWIIDHGPDAGSAGGQGVRGTPGDLVKSATSLIAEHVRRDLESYVPA